MHDQSEWLLHSQEPWTRYRTLVDLLDQPETSKEVMDARQVMLDHPQIRSLIESASSWPGYALKRHNDAKHPIYKISTLADFGLRVFDPGMKDVVTTVLAHQSPEGAYETPVFIPKAFGGTDQEQWAWILCDSPTLLYSLLAMGLGEELGVARAVDHLISLVEENGWRCTASPELGKFKGPGRRTDPCPIANVYVLKALSEIPDQIDSPAAHLGTEVILGHWQIRKEKKYYLFGMGTDFSKLKYPFIWYDILHVVEVLSRFPFVYADPRFQEMVETITDQANAEGRFTASSMYLAWKGWSFADKKNPSPWLTFLVLRLQKRIGIPIGSH
ncbi:hypothetical protein ACFLY4_05865 [Chloroflexota bacterium]